MTLSFAFKNNLLNAWTSIKKYKTIYMDDKPNECKNNYGQHEVVGLEVEEVVYDPVCPFFWIPKVGETKSGCVQDELIKRLKRGNVHFAHWNESVSSNLKNNTTVLLILYVHN